MLMTTWWKSQSLAVRRVARSTGVQDSRAVSPASRSAAQETRNYFKTSDDLIDDCAATAPVSAEIDVGQDSGVSAIAAAAWLGRISGADTFVPRYGRRNENRSTALNWIGRGYWR